jgi:hypothetical protein
MRAGMLISEQFQTIQDLIIQSVEATPEKSITQAAADVLNNLLALNSTQDHIDPVVARIACEENRMQLAENMRFTARMPLSALISTVSDTSLTLVEKTLDFAAGNAPNDHAMSEEALHPHRLFYELNPTEIRLVAYYLEQPDTSVNDALQLLNGITRDEVKHIEYYTNNIKLTLSQALAQITHSRPLTNPAVETLQYAKKYLSVLTAEEAAAAHFQKTGIDLVTGSTANFGQVATTSVGVVTPAITGLNTPVSTAGNIAGGQSNNSFFNMFSNLDPVLIAFTLLAGGLIFAGLTLTKNGFFSCRRNRNLRRDNLDFAMEPPATYRQ